MARPQSDTVRQHREMAARYNVTPQTLKDWGIYHDTPPNVLSRILALKLNENDETCAAIIDQSAEMEKDRAIIKGMGNNE